MQEKKVVSAWNRDGRGGWISKSDGQGPGLEVEVEFFVLNVVHKENKINIAAVWKKHILALVSNFVIKTFILSPLLHQHQVTVNSAFLLFIFLIQFTDRILRNPRKIESSFDDFQSKQNQNPKADNFFELTDYKQIFLKVRSNYSKILGNNQNFLVNIIFYHIYLQIHHLNLVQFVYYLW